MSFDWIIKIFTENWPMFIRGAGITLLIALIGTIIGTMIGLIIGVIRTIPIPEKGMKRALLKFINAILSIDKGQFEAAHAIGMNHLQTMTNVVLPQVLRNILPATGNEFVINIKDTSVLNVISVSELFFATKSIAGNNFKYFESFFIASVIYLIMTFTVTRILRYLERKLEGPENYNLAGNQMQVDTPKIPSNH